jgi:hypothetical protein
MKNLKMEKFPIHFCLVYFSSCRLCDCMELLSQEKAQKRCTYAARRSGKRIDFCDSLTQRGLKDAATHVGEFLKTWTVQAEP